MAGDGDDEVGAGQPCFQLRRGLAAKCSEPFALGAGEVTLFGDDYPTRDGTGVRDYIHVVDLAIGHIAALQKLTENPGVVAYNLGTGQGYSVLEMVAAFEKASGRQIPYRIVGRRPGDIAETYADAGKARRELGWAAKLGLAEMCADAWRWQSQNPQGFAG